jgi:hypothetical protein
MKKIVLLFLFCTTLLSCTEKEKTYEELEAEVLCDVLPQLSIEYNIDQFLRPPFPPRDSLKISKSAYLKSKIIFLESIKEKKTQLKEKLKVDKNFKIGIYNQMHEINNIEFTLLINRFSFSPLALIDSLKSRKIDDRMFMKSNQIITTYSKEQMINVEYLPNKEDAFYLISRIVIDTNFKKVFFKIHYPGCISLNRIVLSEKKNNKWVVKEIIEN